jgi:hypothetical protein
MEAMESRGRKALAVQAWMPFSGCHSSRPTPFRALQVQQAIWHSDRMEVEE